MSWFVVERSIREALRREVNRLRRSHKEYSFHQIIGKSKPMQEIFDLIRRVADSPTNLVITGERNRQEVGSQGDPLQ
jgi:DNA-binding NtrC family response regulator